jgi:hypothetical protein
MTDLENKPGQESDLLDVTVRPHEPSRIRKGFNPSGEDCARIQSRGNRAKGELECRAERDPGLTSEVLPSMFEERVVFVRGLFLQ